MAASCQSPLPQEPERPVMKLRCAILDDYQNAALASADWTPLADEIEVTTLDQHLPPDALVRRIADCEIVVAMRERTPLDAAVLARLPRLKLLVTTGMRNASIDVAAAARHGIVVCGTRSETHPTVELTWALILGLARRIVPETTALRTGGPWQSSLGQDLAGSRLGILGLGRLGSRVAAVGLAFGMAVEAWSPNLTAERARAAGVDLAPSKEALLERADIVSIHLVLGERTRGLIGAGDIARMKPTAFLVNTSRAPIVDAEALAEALRAGRIAGAGLDVFDTEPLPADSVWRGLDRGLDNVLATPHLGYVTRGNYRTFFEDVVADIRAFLDGAPLRRIEA